MENDDTKASEVVTDSKMDSKKSIEGNLEEEAKDTWDPDQPEIITREDRKKNKPNAAKKRGFYKKCLKRSSATDDIDSIGQSKGGESTSSS